MLDAIETSKNNVVDVLDAAMDRVGYTAYKIFNLRCIGILGPWRDCSNGEVQELTQLVRDFANNLEDAIDY